MATKKPFETSLKGMSSVKPPDPCQIVIFGAAGDLAHRSLYPALFSLYCRELLPPKFSLVGFSREDFTTETFRAEMEKAVSKQPGFDSARWSEFSKRMAYCPGNFAASADQDYRRLADLLRELRAKEGVPDNVLFHLAVPPSFYDPIVARLSGSGLSQSDQGWRRVVIEKPFGRDRASARALHESVRKVFDEDQIYRIDHYLGKETVQNMLVFRFANPSYEPIWNRNYIDHVQITVAEELGIGTRGSFYEQTGVVRDMLQNHLFQLMCMVAMEPPLRFDASALRNETVKVLEAVSPLNLDTDCVRGQYGPAGGAKGYRQEAAVDPQSNTVTYAALKLAIDNWRWAGVPFYLRSGKKMARKLSEITVIFKPTPHLMFQLPDGETRQRNILSFRLQPQEGIVNTFFAKQPGPEITLSPVTMNFLYSEAFELAEAPSSYEWLLLDVMQGEQALFARGDWVEQSWSLIDPLVARWQESRAAEFPNYAGGSWGPDAATQLLARDGREWLAI